MLLPPDPSGETVKPVVDLAHEKLRNPGQSLADRTHLQPKQGSEFLDFVSKMSHTHRAVMGGTVRVPTIDEFARAALEPIA